MFKWHLYVDEGGLFGTPTFLAYGWFYHWWHKKSILNATGEFNLEYLGKIAPELAQYVVDARMEKIKERCGWDPSRYIEYYNDKKLTD